MRNYPFLRLLLPLVAGIACADSCFFQSIRIQETWLVAGLVLLLCIFTITYFIKQHALRWLPGIAINLFFFFLGFLSTDFHLGSSAYQFPSEKNSYRALITSGGSTKARSVLYNACVIERFDSLTTPVNRKVLLYFQSDSLSESLRKGEEVIFHGSLSLPRNKGNPQEFDYPRYLIRKGISATGFVASSGWATTSRSSSVTLQEKALQCRDKVLNIYRKCGFEGDEFAVLSALTVGYKEELSEDIRESFSVSGVSHVLALSGLHVGFIFWLLFAVFKRLFGSSIPALVLRTFLVILALWFFAFVAGLSPSVVRSVLMFSLLAITSARSGRLLTFHSLSFTAFLMLVYNPAWLFDVGFQLSFTAVAGIVLIQPKLHYLVKVNNRFLKPVWNLLTVSTAAQIATTPLVLFYFSRFATHFLLTNLVVIPLVTFTIYGAVILLIVFPIPIIQQIIAGMMRLLLRMLSQTVRWVEQLPFASVDNLWLTPLALVTIYLMLLLITTTGKRNKGRQLVLVMGCLLILATHNLWIHLSEPANPPIAFYHVRNCPAVHCTSGNRKSWMAFADTLPQKERLYRNLSPYWVRKGIKEPEAVTKDYSEENFIRMDNFLLFEGKYICMLNDDRWDNKSADRPLNIDYLYVCNGFTREIESLVHLFNIRNIVLDSSIPLYRQQPLVLEAERLGIPCVSLSDGAFILPC